jgi:hypothetical protein
MIRGRSVSTVLKGTLTPRNRKARQWRAVRVCVKRKYPFSTNGLICAGFRPFGRVVNNPKGAVMPAFNLSTPLPCLGRFAEVWPVHADSARGPVKFHPLTRKQAYEIWNRARE